MQEPQPIKPIKPIRVTSFDAQMQIDERYKVPSNNWHFPEDPITITVEPRYIDPAMMQMLHPATPRRSLTFEFAPARRSRWQRLWHAFSTKLRANLALILIVAMLSGVAALVLSLVMLLGGGILHWNP